MNPVNPKNLQEYSDRSLRPGPSRVAFRGKIELFMTHRERNEIARRNPRPYNLASFVREVIKSELAGVLPPIAKVREPENNARQGISIRMPPSTAEDLQSLAHLHRMTTSDYLVNRLLTLPVIERHKGYVPPVRKNRRILDQAGKKEIALVRIGKVLAALHRAVNRHLAAGELERAQRLLDRVTRAIEAIRNGEPLSCS